MTEFGDIRTEPVGPVGAVGQPVAMPVVRPPLPEPASTYGTRRDWLALRRQKNDQRLRASIASALESDPDVIAEATRIGLDVNVDPRQVSTDISGFLKVQQKVQADRWQAARGSPVLRQQMMDPTFAQMAIDDLPQMGLIERIQWGFEYGQAVADAGQVAAEIRANERLSPEERQGFLEAQPSMRRLRELARSNPGGAWATAAEFAGQMSVTIPRAIETGLGAGLAAGGVAIAAGQLGPQVFTPEEIVTAPLAFGIAGLKAGAATQIWYDAAQIEGGHLYADLVADGVPHEIAAPVSRTAGAISGGLELVGMERFLGAAVAPAVRTVRDRLLTDGAREAGRRMAQGGFAQGAKDLAKGWATGVGAEVVTEGLQEVVGIIAENESKIRTGTFSSSELVEWDEAVGRVADVMWKTAQGMSLLALPGPVVHVALRERERTDQARRDAENTERLAEALRGSKAAQRSPEAAATLMQATADGTRAETTYVAGDKLAEALAQSDRSVDEFQAEFPEVAAQIPGAVAGGGDVAIPSGLYNAKILNTPLGEALAQHTRLDEDGSTLAEAEVVEELQPELNEAAGAEIERSATFLEEGHAVGEEFRQQLLASRRVDKKVARASSQIYRAFVETQAAQLNMTPREFHEQHGIRVERGEAPTTRAESGTESLAQTAPQRAEFFSALRREVDALSTKATTGAGWKQALSGLIKKGKVKQEEVEWVGLNDWLDLAEGKVSKEQLAEWLTTAEVRVETETRRARDEARLRSLERDLRDTNAAIDRNIVTRQEVFAEGPERFAEEEAGLDALDQQLRTERESINQEIVELQGPTAGQFGQYVVPGEHENYREILVTLPEQEGEGFESPHFRGAGKVVAHVRVTDREVDGKRVLFVEEVQSDWAQTGRQRGFSEEGPRRAVAVKDRVAGDLTWEVLDQEGNFVTNVPLEFNGEPITAEQAITEANRRLESEPYRVARRAGIPRAPFVETTKGWLNLALKQVLLEAVNGGYDQVMVINGQQAADLYDLSQRVESIGVEIGPQEGQRTVSIHRLGDGEVEASALVDDSGRVTGADSVLREAEGKRLDEVVGKDLADKIMAVDFAESDEVTFSGVDLRVGGEGMAAFYDRIVPQALNKLSKRNQGQKTTREGGVQGGQEQTTLEVTEPLRDSVSEGLALFAREGDAIRAEFIPSTRTIRLLEGADVTSVLHELSHGFLDLYGQLAAQEGPTQARAHMEAFLESRGIEGGIDAWNAMSLEQQRPHHEAFAEQAEVYFQTGEAPSVGLQGLFRDFRRWIVQLWRNVRGVVPETVPEEVQQMLDRMLASQDAVEHAAAVRGLSQSFGPKPEGMAQEDYNRIQQARADSIASADEYVTARGLRDMQWQDNARTGKLHELQQQHRKVRKAAREEVAEELEADPVYRAQDFLRTGRFVNADGVVQEVEGPHKLRTDAVREILGLNRRRGERRLADMELLEAVVAVGGLRREDALGLGDFADDIGKRVGVVPVFPKKGGKSLDRVLEALTENGDWRFADEDALLDAIGESLAGAEVRSPFADVGSQQQQAAKEQERRTGVTAAPETPAPKLSSLLPGMTNPEGLDPDVVAPWFGWESGREMVRDLAEAPKLRDAVDAATDARMLAEHGELEGAAAVRRAVNEGLNHPARARAMATQLAGLQRGRTPVRLLIAGARRFAQDTLANTPVNLIKPWRYQGAEARANRELHRALKAADTEAAIRAQWAELAQHELAKEAAKVEDEIAKSGKLFNWFKGTDKNLSKKHEIDLVRVGRSLLRSVQVLPPAEGQTARQEDAAMESVGRDFYNVASDLKALADEFGGTPYRRLTLDQYRNLVDMANAIQDLSRSENVVKREGRRFQVEQLAEEGAAQVAELPRRRAKGALVPTGITPSNPAKWMSKLWDFEASSKRAFMWARFMDGGKDRGFFQDNFVYPVWEATDQMRNKTEEILSDMRARIRALEEYYGDAWDRTIVAQPTELDGGFTFRGMRQLSDVIMDLGNDSNREKRIAGEAWAPRPSETDGVLRRGGFDRFLARVEQELQGSGRSLEPAFDFAQAMQNQFEELLPLAQKVYKELLGYEFKEIPPVPFVMFGKEYAGGYAPLRMDPYRSRLSKRQEMREDLTSINELEQAAEYSRHNVNVNRNFTIERNANAYDALTIDIAQRVGAFEMELRYLYMAPVIKSMERLVREETFADELTSYDPSAITSILTPYMETLARQSVATPSGNQFVDDAASYFRQNVGVAALGFNVTTAAIQSTGLVASAAGMKARFFWHGIGRVARNPFQAHREAVTRDPRMRRRLQIQDRRIAQAINRQKYNAKWSRNLAAARDELTNAAYWMILRMQGLVDVATWHGAYQQALAEADVGDGTREEMEAAEKHAVRAATLMVEHTQGAMDPEHAPKIEVGHPIWRLAFQFMSFSNTMLNRALGRAAAQETGMRGAWAFVWPILLLSFFEGAARATVQGLPDDEDEDGILNDLAVSYGAAVSRNMTGMIPRIGPMLGSAIDVALGESGSVRTSTPAAAMVEQALRAMVQGADTKTAGRVATSVFGFPIHLLTDRADYLQDVGAGDVDPTSGYDFLRGLLTGRASEASR